MRRARNDGAGHRLLEKQRSCRWIVRGVIPANLSPTRGEAATGDNKTNTSVTYGVATLHSRQSRGRDIHGESKPITRSSALPRSPRSAEDFFDIHDRNLIAELLAVSPIPISQQIFRCRVEGK